jgi:hypothetical protein
MKGLARFLWLLKAAGFCSLADMFSRGSDDDGSLPPVGVISPGSGLVWLTPRIELDPRFFFFFFFFFFFSSLN